MGKDHYLYFFLLHLSTIWIHLKKILTVRQNSFVVVYCVAQTTNFTYIIETTVSGFSKSVEKYKRVCKTEKQPSFWKIGEKEQRRILKMTK